MNFTNPSEKEDIMKVLQIFKKSKFKIIPVNPHGTGAIRIQINDLFSLVKFKIRCDREKAHFTIPFKPIIKLFNTNSQCTHYTLYNCTHIMNKSTP